MRANQLTTDEFIRRSIEKHSGKYTYEKTVYINNVSTVTVNCPIHGYFDQKADSHISGHGCPKCGGKKKLSTEQYITRCIDSHGDRYDYSMVVYTTAGNKVKIRCKKHDHVFEQRARDHPTKKCGCKYCINGTTQDFIDDAIAVHQTNNGQQKYDYSLVNYVNATTPVKIICREHGEFIKEPFDHIKNGTGCPHCVLDEKRLSKEEFLDKCRNSHANSQIEYDYSLVEYKSFRHKIKIVCPKHGVFEQIAQSHANGHGCKKCMRHTSTPADEWLDSLGISELIREYPLPENFRRKVDGYDPTTNTVYQFHGDYWHSNPVIYKSDSYHARKKQTHGEVYIESCNKDDEIRNLGYNLVIMWESDWKKLKKQQIGNNNGCEE